MTTKPKGVMIVGMEMPRNCVECPLSRIREYCGGSEVLWECIIFYKEGTKTKRPVWCPLQEVK